MDKNMSAPPPPGFAPPPGYTAQPPPSYFADQSMPSNAYGQPPPTTNVIVVGTPAFGSESQRLTCPHCHNIISTAVETEANTKTHMFAFLLCIFGLFCLAPCPYCIDSCMTAKHYCPSCRAYLGQSNN